MFKVIKFSSSNLMLPTAGKCVPTRLAHSRAHAPPALHWARMDLHASSRAPLQDPPSQELSLELLSLEPHQVIRSWLL